jgi:rhamnose utilization protein RhaD (predicted bifunctional aldolase and dehydrogenase)
MNKALTDLIKISKKVGKDPSLTQGGSGNTSVKTDDGKSMFIKASGTALKDMSKKRGWRKINLKKVREVIKDKKLVKLSPPQRESEIAGRLLAACEDNIKGNFRPSVEANLHAFLDKYVIHLHPAAVGALVNSKNGKFELKKLFAKEKLPLLWVPYANPGYSLAKKIANLCSQYRKKHNRLPGILFLEKHGLFVSAGKSIQALNLVREVINLCNKKLTCPVIKEIKKPDAEIIKQAKLIIEDAFFKASGQHKPVYFFHNKNLAAYIHRDDSGKLLRAGSINPNEIAYCNGPAIWLEKLQKNKILAALKNQIAKNHKPPLAFLVKNFGLFVIGNAKSASIIEQIVSNALFIRYNAQKFGGIAALTKSEQEFIYNCGA